VNGCIFLSLPFHSTQSGGKISYRFIVHVAEFFARDFAHPCGDLVRVSGGGGGFEAGDDERHVDGFLRGCCFWFGLGMEDGRWKMEDGRWMKEEGYL
jgi:hypothetical protein